MTAQLITRITDALKTVREPELDRDLVDLGAVQDVSASGGVAQITLVLPTPQWPNKERLARAARAAVAGVDGVAEVRVDWASGPRRTVPAGNDLIPGVRNLVLVGSGKGGVGKSTVAVNVALELAREGARVGLMDADIYGPNQPTMLGVRGQPQGEGNKIKPFSGPAGLTLISIGFFLKDDEPVIWRGPMLHGAVRQFLADVAWGELDYLVVDLPPGTGDVQLTLSQIVPVSGAVMVTTPQAVALEDVKKSALAMNRVNIPILGIVENMSGYTCRHCGVTEDVFGRGGGRRVAAEFEVPFLGEVPLDPRVMTGSDAGRPIILHEPESPVAQALVRVARAAAAQVGINAARQGEPPSVTRMPRPLPSQQG